jgi:hypothetical protein
MRHMRSMVVVTTIHSGPKDLLGSRSLQLCDDKGPNGDVFLHVDQQLREQPRALVCPQLANAGDPILLGEGEDVEQEGADFRTKGVDPLAETALGRRLIHPLTLRRLFEETPEGLPTESSEAGGMGSLGDVSPARGWTGGSSFKAPPLRRAKPPPRLRSECCL